MMEWFTKEGFLKKNDYETYDITLLGAICFANDMTQFPLLVRKTVTVIKYQDNSKLGIQVSHVWKHGYVLCFSDILNYVKGLVSDSEPIHDQGISYQNLKYPEPALREALTNMLIHQDLLDQSYGPSIEIFLNHIDFINPGKLDIPADRVLDSSPKSQNTALALFLMQIGIGEEKGTGFDKMVSYCEQRHQPS